MSEAENEVKAATAKIYLGGVPTAPDVDRIVKALGVPEPGVITHQTLSEIIGKKYPSNRYDAVTRAWRLLLMREHRIGTKAEPGVGIRIMTAHEWVDEQVRQFRGSVRHVVRVHGVTAQIPQEQLDEAHRIKHGHLITQSASLGHKAAESNSSLRKALKAPAQLPKAF